MTKKYVWRLFCRLLSAHLFFCLGDSLSEDVEPVLIDYVTHIEKHEAVALLEVHLHSTPEAVGIAVVLLYIHAAIERPAAQQLARIIARTFDTQMVAFRKSAVRFVLHPAVM